MVPGAECAHLRRAGRSTPDRGFRRRFSGGGKPAVYLTRNDTTPIESPVQAWNVLTIGAYTEKITIADKDYAGWSIFATAGDLMPTSRTSVNWNLDWPLKPDVVRKGGNLGIDPATGAGDNVDDEGVDALRRGCDAAVFGLKCPLLRGVLPEFALPATAPVCSPRTPQRNPPCPDPWTDSGSSI